MIEDIELFIKLVDTGGYTELSRVTGIAITTIVRRMRQLEETLKVSLFIMNQRSLQLSNDGIEAYKHFKPTVSNIANSIDEYYSRQNNSEGELRVVIRDDYFRHFLNTTIQDFTYDHPEIRITLLSNFMIGYTEYPFDVAISHTFPASNYFRIKLLVEDNVTLIASKKYLELHGTPREPHDLFKHKLCVPILDDTGILNSWELIHRTRNDEKYIITINHPVYASNSGEFMLHLLKNNLGVIPMTNFVVDQMLEQDASLIRVLPEWRFERPLRIYSIRPTLNQNVRVSLFLKYVQKTVNEIQEKMLLTRS